VGTVNLLTTSHRRIIVEVEAYSAATTEEVYFDKYLRVVFNEQ
jgi:hypothetical protein